MKRRLNQEIAMAKRTQNLLSRFWIASVSVEEFGYTVQVFDREFKIESVDSFRFVDKNRIIQSETIEPVALGVFNVFLNDDVLIGSDAWVQSCNTGADEIVTAGTMPYRVEGDLLQDEEVEFLKQRFPEFEVWPHVHTNEWQCMCSHVNVQSETCSLCGLKKRESQNVLEYDYHSDFLTSLFEMVEKSDEVSDEEYLEYIKQKSRLSLDEIAIEYAIYAESSKDKVESINSKIKESQRMKSAQYLYATSTLSIIGIIITLLIATVSVTEVYTLSSGPYRDYSNAERVFAEGQYTDAHSMFAALGDFKDAPVRAFDMLLYDLEQGFEQNSYDNTSYYIWDKISLYTVPFNQEKWWMQEEYVNRFADFLTRLNEKQKIYEAWLCIYTTDMAIKSNQGQGTSDLLKSLLDKQLSLAMEYVDAYGTLDEVAVLYRDSLHQSSNSQNFNMSRLLTLTRDALYPVDDTLDYNTLINLSQSGTLWNAIIVLENDYDLYNQVTDFISQLLRDVPESRLTDDVINGLVTQVLVMPDRYKDVIEELELHRTFANIMVGTTNSVTEINENLMPYHTYNLSYFGTLIPGEIIYLDLLLNDYSGSGNIVIDVSTPYDKQHYVLQSGVTTPIPVQGPWDDSQIEGFYINIRLLAQEIDIYLRTE